MRLSITIRPYRDADFDAITWLCLHSWKSNRVETPVFESNITHLRRKFRTPEIANGTTYVATMGNRIVAFVLFNGNEIADLFVAPAVQRQGIGKQLLDFAKTKHAGGLWLTTLAPNTKARRFYEREGLTLRVTRVGRRPGYRICWYDWRPGTPSRPRAFSPSLRKQLASQTRSKAR